MSDIVKTHTEIQIQKRENSIQLIKDVISKKTPLVQLEMSLEIKETFNKALVRSVIKDDNDNLTFTFTTALVKRFMDSFGFSTKMTESQIEILTIDTIENFSYESIEDIIIFFKMARSGKFGTTIRGVDSNLIYGTWFLQYLELKAIERENQYTKEKSKNVGLRRGMSKEEIHEYYKNLEKKNTKKKAEEYIDNMIINFDRQMLEDTIIDWQKDDYKKQFVHILKSKRKLFR